MNQEKKQMVIFLIVAYGVTYGLGLFMWYGFAKGADVSVFPSAQMMYPVAGVMLAYLVTRKDDSRLPKWFFRGVLFVTAMLIVLAIVSVVVPKTMTTMGVSVSLWVMTSQYILIIGSIVCWVLYLISSKEKREAYGFRWKNSKASAVCILLFLLLYFLRALLSCAVSGQLEYFVVFILGSPVTWISLFSLAINFFLVYIAFLGEEYGWRYYLQPIMQKKFGPRAGVLLLGVVWGLWHLPIDFFYYSPAAGLAAAAAQQITCISLGIFFAYAYMKTENIWVPVVLHFLNNNLVPVISGTYSADVLQNQDIDWMQLPFALVVNFLLFGVFIYTKEFRRGKAPSESEEKAAG